MSRPGREPRLRELLEVALALPPAERRAALVERSADSTLVDEVLTVAEREDTAGALDADPHALPPPEIPGFTLLRPLGAGGMGRVYLARQTGAVERLVAIKMIGPSFAGPRAARRFGFERRALARLNHPAIAQLYAADTTPDGRPYVVMEYVDGPPITEYCDRERLPIEARLRLFVEVCRGVEHAHRRQLLHRDLKPSNVLVATGDGTPVPKIIDFGIARALDRVADEGPLHTGALVLGTPHYMSPEALAPVDGPRDLDTRTDVYSLGVILYELLTGARPFPGRGDDLPSLFRHLTEGEPPRPSSRVERLDGDTRQQVATARAGEARQLASRLGGDLDWIALKALERDREKRYGSAAALADDIERSLRDEPIVARPASLGDRLLKLARRHRLAATLAAIALAAVAAAAVISSISLVRTRRAERQAQAEAAASRETLAFLVDLFGAARPEEDLGRELTARQVVARGADAIDEQDLPPLQRARLLHTLADVQVRLGDYDSGRELATAALALRERDLPRDHPDFVASLDLLANLERRAGRLEEAERHVERLVAASERQGEPVSLAAALNTFGNLRWRQGRLDEAQRLHERSLALRRHAAAADPALDTEVAASLNNLGVLIWSQDRPADAEPSLREAAELLERRLGPDHPRVADARGNLASVLLNLERPAEAEALHRSVLATRERVLGPDHPDTAASLNNLAVTLARSGREAEAVPLYRRALDVRRRAMGDEHAETLRTATNLGALLGRTGGFAEGEALLREVLETRTRTLGPRHSDTARTLYRLGALLRQAGRDDEAEELLRRALNVQLGLDPPRPEHIAETRRELAALAGSASPE